MIRLAFSKPTSCSNEFSELLRYREFGYNGLQLKPAQYAAYAKAPELMAQEHPALAGGLSALIFGGNLDTEGVARLRRTIALASTLGAEKIVFCHGVPRDSVNDDGIREFARVLSELAVEAAHAEVGLSLHHHFNQPVMRRRDFDTFFGAVSGPVGLTVDTAHLIKSGVEDVPELIQSFSDHIDNFHIKDIAAGEFCILGRGELDLDGILAAIGRIDYNGWVSADEESGAGVVEAMVECSSHLGRLVETNPT